MVAAVSVNANVDLMFCVSRAFREEITVIISNNSLLVSALDYLRETNLCYALRYFFLRNM